MRRRKLHVASALVGVVLAGCSLLTELGSLGGGDLDASDVVVTNDASPDGDAGAFCDMQSDVVFCCDFDKGNMCTLAPMQFVGTLTIDDAGSSPPHSLQSAIQPLDEAGATTNGTWGLGVAPTAAFRAGRLRFSVFVESPGSLNSKIAAISTLMGSNKCDVSIVMTPGAGTHSLALQASVMTDGGVPTYTPISGSGGLTGNTWVDVTLMVDFDARKVSLEVGPILVIDSADLPADFPKLVPRFEVGFHYAPGPSTARLAHFDNVTFELLP
jgi:hypothetical protein